MTRGNRTWFAVVALLATGAAARADGYVDRRGGADRLVGDVETIDDAGVHVRTDGGRVIVPWDRVQSVRTERPLPGLDERLPFAEMAWRARSRVERADHARAEPLLDTLFETTLGGTHETALVVAEGLLRCRVARGAHEDAVIPALEVMRLRGLGFQTASYAALPPAIDGETGLCRVLAPDFAAPRRAGRLGRELDVYIDRLPENAEQVRQCATIYQVAALDAAGRGDEAPDLPERGDLQDPGLQWLIDLVLADGPDEGERRAARARLTRALADTDDLEADPARRWQDAWTQFALGRSLLRESDSRLREAGVLAILHLPARFARDQPYLAGIALADAASALRELSDPAGADALTTELSQRWPAHPARAGLAIRSRTSS